MAFNITNLPFLPAENMAPKRKRKRSALQPSDWEAQRSAIQKLYMTENKPLKEVIEIMRENNFDATKGQYEIWLANWGFRKHFTDCDWIFIYRQIENRKRQNKDTLIRLNSTLVPNQKVKDELRRHVLPSQELILASSLGIHEETPKGIFVQTPATIAYNTIRLDNIPFFQFKGFVQSQIRFDQSLKSPVDQPRKFWPDLEDQTLPFRSNSENEYEWPLGDGPIYASTIRPIAERSLQEMRSIFGLTVPPNAEPSSTNYHSMMMSLLPQLEIDVPDFPTEQFKENWEMLPWSSHADTVLNFLEFAVYLSSNNMLELDQTKAVLQWLVSSGNRPALDALVSSRLPTAQACIHEVFKCALRTGQLQVARTLIDAKIDFSEILQNSRRILGEAVLKSDVELTQFLLQGGVDLSRCFGLLHLTESVEIAQLLLEAGVDVNELKLCDPFLATALGQAVTRSNFKLAEFLIKKGADVNLAQKTMYAGIITPLIEALEGEDVRLIELLLDEGAEVDAPSCVWEELLHNNVLYFDRNYLATPLQVAAARGDVRLAMPLLRWGADVDAPGYTMSALHWAVKSGSIEMVRLLLAHHADPNMPADNEHGSTAIQFAAEQGNTDMIQILLDAGAKIDNSADLCPLRGQLRQAIRDGCIDRARATLRLGINVNRPFLDRSTLLQEAILKDDAAMVQLLVEAGADVNMPCRSSSVPGSMVTPLQLTLEFTGRKRNEFDTLRLDVAQIAEILLNSGAKPNPPCSLLNMCSPLQSATACEGLAQAYDLVQLLLRAGASVNLRAGHCSCQKSTAFQNAVRGWSRFTGFDLLQLLLDYGADVNAPAAGDVGFTALTMAVTIGEMDLIRFLLKNGADVNSPACDIGGRTALQEAAEMVERKSSLQAGNISEERRLEVVELLMKEGADVNAPPADGCGRTALQAATITEKGSIKLIQRLIDAGADVNAPAGAWRGSTALQGAAIRGHIKFALMLLEENADVNAPGSRTYGRTALEGAAEHGRLDMVQLLINAGADSHLPGRQRYRSAAALAVVECHCAVAGLLKARFEE